MERNETRLRLLTSGAGLESEVFDREFDFPRPVDTNIEGSCDISKTSFESVPSSVREVLKVENAGKQGENRFNDHALVPPSFLADFAVGGVAFFSMEAAIA